MEQNSPISPNAQETQLTFNVPRVISSMEHPTSLPIREPDDHPLLALEITRKFGAPVFFDGVELIAASHDYMALQNKVAGNDSRSDPQSQILEARGIELAKDFRHSETELNLFLLKVRDSRIYRGWINPANDQPFRTFKGYCEEVFRISKPTAYRKIRRAQLLLIFAAHGMIDAVPEHGEMNKLQKLPRVHWLPAWKAIREAGTSGSREVEFAAICYAQKHEIPYGTAKPAIVSMQPVLLLEWTGSHDIEPSVPAKPAANPKTSRKALLEAADPIISKYLPASTLAKLRKNGTDPAEAFLRAYLAYGERDRKIATTTAKRNRQLLSELKKHGIPIAAFIDRAIADALRNAKERMSH